MKKTAKTLLCCIILFVLCLPLSGCIEKANKYTEEEHLRRVSERIYVKYIDGDRVLSPDDGRPDEDRETIKATGFEVFPLYNENDELEYFLVEFQPYGFIYGHIRDELSVPLAFLKRGNGSGGMYLLSKIGGEPAWKSCRLQSNESDVTWGAAMFYHSPFAIQGIENERRYLIYCEESNVGATLLPAVKRNGKFVNLYSNDSFEMTNGKVAEYQAASTQIAFHSTKSNEL